jgi:hypothetical protein
MGKLACTDTSDHPDEALARPDLEAALRQGPVPDLGANHFHPVPCGLAVPNDVAADLGVAFQFVLKIDLERCDA